MSSIPIPKGVDIWASRQPQAYAATITTYALAVLAVALRFWSRRLLKARYCLDDWLVAAAVLVTTGLSTNIISCESLSMINHVGHFNAKFAHGLSIGIVQGFGKHFQVLGPDFFTVFFKHLFIGEILYTLVLCLVKYSILAFYWRLFGSSIRIPMYVFGSIVSAWGVAVMLVTIFQCNPISGFWNRNLPARCDVKQTYFCLGTAIPNIVTDVALLVLPIPYIWRIQRPTSQKIALAGIFMLGGFVCIISAFRLVALINGDIASLDLDWNYVQVGIWTATECNMAIVSACLPSLRPILSLVITGSPRPSDKSEYHLSKRTVWSQIWNRNRNVSSTSHADEAMVNDNDNRRFSVSVPEEVDNQYGQPKPVSFPNTIQATHKNEQQQQDRATQVNVLNTRELNKKQAKAGTYQTWADIEMQRLSEKDHFISVQSDVAIEWTEGHMF